MLKPASDPKTAVLTRTPEGGHALRLSDGRQRVFSPSEPPAEQASVAWSPDGRWLGLLRGRQVSILDRDLNEVWSTTLLKSPPICAWDYRDTRLFIGNADARAYTCVSLLPVDIAPGTVWQTETRLWEYWVDVGGSGWRAKRGELEATEAAWFPGPFDDLLVEVTPGPNAIGEDSYASTRLLVLAAHRFHSSPLAELGAGHCLEGARWAKDGDHVAWAASVGLRIWQVGSAHITSFFSGTLAHPFSVKRLDLSSSGKHLFVVLHRFYSSADPEPFGELKAGPPLIIRVADGGTVTLNDVPGVSIAEWEGDDEIYIGYDLQPDPEGGYRYQWQGCIRVSDIPRPWHATGLEEYPALGPPVTTHIPHSGRDYSQLLPLLPVLPTTAPMEIRLAFPRHGPVLGRRELAPGQLAASDEETLVVMQCQSRRRLLLVAVSTRTARVRSLLAVEGVNDPPLFLKLSIRELLPAAELPAACSFAVPVITAPASFGCEAPGVECVAFWS